MTDDLRQREWRPEGCRCRVPERARCFLCREFYCAACWRNVGVDHCEDDNMRLEDIGDFGDA